MVQVMDAVSRFFAGATFLVYLCIFLGKILEVSLATLRIVLINRGERMIGAAIALIEVLLWLIIAASVLSDYKTDPIKMFTYAFAFALGNFMGSWLEEKLAFGLSSIQVVVKSLEKSDFICAELRKSGFGVTQLVTQGMDGAERYLIMCTLKRKLSQEAIDLIQGVEPGAVITVSDVKSQRGGYFQVTAPRRRHGK